MLAGLVHEDNQFVLVFPELVPTFLKLGHGNVLRPADVALGKLFPLAHIHHNRFLPVEHEHGFLGADLAPGTTAFHPEKRQQQHKEGADQHPVIEGKLE